tara:strand:- start:989 stop:1129 length:141 start_codon:yes stop_codon:yes gene_type:complete
MAMLLWNEACLFIRSMINYPVGDLILHHLTKTYFLQLYHLQQELLT